MTSHPTARATAFTRAEMAALVSVPGQYHPILDPLGVDPLAALR